MNENTYPNGKIFIGQDRIGCANYVNDLPGYPCAWSPDQLHRYALWRIFGTTIPKKIFMVVGLNPSTADELLDDPTVRRCQTFARREGCDALLMTNAFSFRATLPKDMKAYFDPIGPENDAWLRRCADISVIKIAAWGVHGKFLGRDEAVRRLIPDLQCFGLTKEGQPKHPLYLRNDTPLEAYGLP
jgi:hypothetical protein